MKKTIGLFFMFFLSSLSFAEKITIVTESFPPFNYQDPASKKIIGISTEIVQAILEEANSKAKIDIYPWARAYNLALTKKNMMIYSIKRTKKRENLFKWVGTIIRHETHFLAVKGSPINPTDDLNDLKKYIIGSIREGANYKNLLADGFRKLELSDNREHNWNKLKYGRMDLWCTNILSAKYIIKSLGENPNNLKMIHMYKKRSKRSLYIAFSKKTNDSIVKKYKNAYIRIKQKGIYGKILNKYDIK